MKNALFICLVLATASIQAQSDESWAIMHQSADIESLTDAVDANTLAIDPHRAGNIALSQANDEIKRLKWELVKEQARAASLRKELQEAKLLAIQAAAHKDTP